MTYGSGLWGAINIHACTGENTQACTDANTQRRKCCYGCLVYLYFSVDFLWNQPGSSAVTDIVGESGPSRCFSYTSTLQSESCHNTAVHMCVRELWHEPSLNWGRATDTTQPQKQTEIQKQSHTHTHREAGPVEGNSNGKMKTENLPQHLCRQERLRDWDQQWCNFDQKTQTPPLKSSLKPTNAVVPCKLKNYSVKKG